MQPKNQKQIDAMRRGGRILAKVLQVVSQGVVPGVTTKQLAEMAAGELKKLGGEPAFLNYQGFPDVMCVSVNDEVVHGIPGPYKLKPGDVVGCDFGVKYGGLITDSCVTLIVPGASDDSSSRLVADTQKALAIGIGAVKAGTNVSQIGAAIEDFLKPKGYGIVEQLVGHGVGQEVHEPPEIPHFRAEGSEYILEAGMTIAIEPMVTLGSEQVYLDKDGWTYRTRDGSLAAQFEHTVLVTESGAEILTQV